MNQATRERADEGSSLSRRFNHRGEDPEHWVHSVELMETHRPLALTIEGTRRMGLEETSFNCVNGGPHSIGLNSLTPSKEELRLPRLPTAS